MYSSSQYTIPHIGILHHRAETICSSPQLLEQEEQYLQKKHSRDANILHGL